MLDKKELRQLAKILFMVFMGAACAEKTMQLRGNATSRCMNSLVQFCWFHLISLSNSLGANHLYLFSG